MTSAPVPTSSPHRLRRWLLGIMILAGLLAVYALALRWVTVQVGQDVENSLRTAPVLDDHTPRVN
ncbi:MAG: hypothetical protein ACR2J7_06905 [Luteimonas sp.]